MRPLPRCKATSMASITREGSALCTLNLSAATSNTRGSSLALPVRWVCTRLKPLALNHACNSSALVLAGNSTGKVMTQRGSPTLKACSCAKMVCALSCFTASAVCLSNNCAARANNNFKWSFSSVMVPTVERELRTGLVWSMAIAAGTPSTLSTAGLSMRSKNCRA